jgi:hypothetical protein
MKEDHSLGFNDQRPRNWLDAFPWLKGVAEHGTVQIWTDAIEGASTPIRNLRLVQLSALAMERLTQWSIGQIFPGLDPELNLLDLRLPARAANALHRHGCHTAADVIPIRVEEMMTWRHVGAGTVDSILQALANASTSMATPAVTSPAATTEPGPAIEDVQRFASLTNDLRRIANWYALVGLPEQPLLGAPLAPGSPDEVLKARERLEYLQARDLLDGESETDVALLFDEALATLDERAVQVLANRLFADAPLTLDDIGRSYGVTRERVRQIEGKARGALLGFISEGGPLAMVADAARSVIGTIRPLDDLLTLMPALGKEVDSVGQPAWRVLDRLDDAYEIEDRWCVVPTMQSAKIVTRTRLEERADQYGVARLADLDLIESSQPEQLSELTAAWISHCGYIVDGEFVLSRTRSVGDYAAAVLSIEGSPLSAQEIVDRFVFDRSARGVGNVLSGDERFERVDRDRWALKEWGMDAYSGIRSIIRELVARGGGRAKLTDVIEYITARYSVSSSSVAAYAGAAPFAITEGIVHLATVARGAQRAPERTRRLFRRRDAWAYRIRISTDHLRGSGSVAPQAIATVLNLHAGDTLQLDSPLGPQAVSWTGLQPSFGTIRRFLMESDVEVDSEAFLVIHDNGSFTFEQTRELIGDPLADALSLVGAPPALNGEEARVALARALALPEGSPVSSIIGGYRERGDDDVAELLLAVRESLETGYNPTEPRRSADIDEILALL